MAAEVVLFSDVEWEQLNPARGDKSPKAGALWGDRTGPGPAGFLLKPIDGFRSPPHIHNVAYRGVVISGLLHNDDPNAEDMWMSQGSFWTQPAGGIHITAAKGDDALAYIEVEDMFGVLPAEQAFDDKEKPVNVDISNIVWINPFDSEGGAKVSFLWGVPQADQLHGALAKLPAGSSVNLQSHRSMLRAVVIQGQLKHQVPGAKIMEPGSYFSSEGKSAHQLSCESEVDCILYIRVNGSFKLST